MNTSHSRLYLHWSFIQPTIEQLEPNLTVASLRADPSLVYEWAATVPNWSVHDQAVAALVIANITPIGEVGEGTIGGLPLYNGKTADPSIIGADLYLAYMYRYSRAVVNRFKAHIGIWQIENELNEAYLSMFSEQRFLHPVHTPWGNWTFLTTLLGTLRDAVKDEQGTGLVLQNLHSDISEHVHEELRLPGYFLDAAVQWQSLLDIVAFDAYPNYYGAMPILASVVGNRTNALRQVLPAHVPVLLMETGYPVMQPNLTDLPAVTNFTEANQGAYAYEAAKGVYENGGMGFLFFKVEPDTGMSPPPGGFTLADIELLDTIALLYNEQKVSIMIAYLLQHGSVEEIITRLQYFVNYDQAWGAIRADGSYRPAVAALKFAFDAICDVNTGV